MSKIKCQLISHSLSPHLSQLYTGFFLLHKQGLIELTQHCKPENFIDNTKTQHLQDARHAHLSVILNDTIKLHYDTHDAIELDEEYLNACDFYFKRSYSSAYVAENFPTHQHKIFPLGLNYHILPSTFDYFALQRLWQLKNPAKGWRHGLIDIIDSKNFIKGNPRLEQLQALPDDNLPAKVLFLVTAYDPYDNPARTQEKVAERVYLNETRAQCIRLLRKELGDNFLGGFSRQKFTEENYKDCLATDDNLTRKGMYLKTLKAYPICIATTGLHGSTGWKMAEYVALSKAIVSEKLLYQVPGQFQAGKNYLEFTTPDECVAQSVRLMTDATLRHEIMTNNAAYYQAFLEPSALILNSLNIALAK